MRAARCPQTILTPRSNACTSSNDRYHGGSYGNGQQGQHKSRARSCLHVQSPVFKSTDFSWLVSRLRGDLNLTGSLDLTGSYQVEFTVQPPSGLLAACRLRSTNFAAPRSAAREPRFRLREDATADDGPSLQAVVVSFSPVGFAGADELPVEVGVDAAARQEFQVRAAFDDPALVQHQDPVGMADRA